MANFKLYLKGGKHIAANLDQNPNDVEKLIGTTAGLINIEDLLAKTEAFMAKMYVVKQDLNLLPKKEHIATCIKYSDLLEMRNEFAREMLASVVRFVYSSDKSSKILQEFIKQGRDEVGAYEMLSLQAKEKFRPYSVKGQFSELLLFNLLQHHFKAVPLLRKMPITTNPNLERNGADAFHIAIKDGKYILYLGEAKTYDRKSNSLKTALKDSISSILENYHNHRNEINLYIYEDFIPRELEGIAKDYINGKNGNIEVHLVCMVTYENNKNVKGANQEQLLNATIESILDETRQIKEDFFKDVPANLLPRFNYIIFPVKEMDDLLKLFKQKLGV